MVGVRFLDEATFQATKKKSFAELNKTAERHEYARYIIARGKKKSTMLLLTTKLMSNFYHILMHHYDH